MLIRTVYAAASSRRTVLITGKHALKSLPGEQSNHQQWDNRRTEHFLLSCTQFHICLTNRK